MVRPEGRTDGTPEGVLVRVNDGPLQAGLQSSLKASPPKGGLIIGPDGPMARRRATACAAILFSSNCLPTSGYSHQACDMWPVPGSHFLFQSACQQAGTADRASNMAGD